MGPMELLRPPPLIIPNAPQEKKNKNDSYKKTKM